MTTKLEEVIALGNQEAAARAGYVITVKEALDAGTLIDHASALKLLNEMKDVNKLNQFAVPEEIQTKLISAIDDLINAL